MHRRVRNCKQTADCIVGKVKQLDENETMQRNIHKAIKKSNVIQGVVWEDHL